MRYRFDTNIQVAALHFRLHRRCTSYLNVTRYSKNTRASRQHECHVTSTQQHFIPVTTQRDRLARTLQKDISIADYRRVQEITYKPSYAATRFPLASGDMIALVRERGVGEVSSVLLLSLLSRSQLFERFSMMHSFTLSAHCTTAKRASITGLMSH